MRVFIAYYIAFIMYSTLFVHPGYAEVVNRVIAVVNGEVVTLFDLQTEAASEIIRQQLDYKKPVDAGKIRNVERLVLENMIDHILLIQEAERLKLVVTKEEVKSEYDHFVVKNHFTPEEFKKQLALQHITEEEFKERIRTNILKSRLLSTMVGRKVVVTKQEIESYYNKNYDKLKGNNQLEIAMIVYPPDSNAEDWSSKIRNGKISFEKVAENVSVGPKAKEGGNLGIIDIEDLNPEWWAYLSKMNPGEFTELININGLKGQLKLINIVYGEPQTLEAVTPYIEEILREPKANERFKEYSEQLRKRAVIDIRH